MDKTGQTSDQDTERGRERGYTLRYRERGWGRDRIGKEEKRERKEGRKVETRGEINRERKVENKW